MKAKKSILFFMLFTVCIFFVGICKAQIDSTTVNIPNSDNSLFLGLSLNQILLIVAGILEIILRVVPTNKNVSIIHFIIKIIDLIVPNKATPEIFKQGGDEVKKKRIFGIFKKDK